MSVERKWKQFSRTPDANTGGDQVLYSEMAKNVAKQVQLVYNETTERTL